MDTETTIPERFVAGAAAGFISQTVVYPLDVILIIVLFSKCIFTLFRNLGFKSTFDTKTNR